MKEDWIEVISSEILDIRDGTHDTPKYIQDEVHPLVTSKNLKQRVLDLTNVKYISEEDFIEINKRSKVDIGDVLFAMIGTIGNPVVIKKEPHYSIKNIGLFKNRFKVIDSNLLGYFLDSTTFYHQLQKKQFLKGTTQKFIPLGHLRKIELPLPPLVEQKAIINKIEELFSSLDSGITDLKKAKEQLAIYRQAVLKKAFEGELTKEWREKQANLPTSEKLLKQIKEERQRLYEEQLNDWKKAVKIWKKNGEEGKKPKKPKKIIDYPEIEQSSTLPILNLGELVFQISNKMMPNEAPEFPFIGMDCLEKNALKPHFTYKFKEFKSAGNWFNTNHVLYGRLRPYLNKVYQAEYEGVASGEFIILETIKSFSPNYLKLILHQQDFVHWANKQSAGDKPRVKYDQIALYPIKVPTIKEQQQIVQEIESRLSVCDKVEESIIESLEKAQALRQSILKKAFEGKLLTKDEIAKCKAQPEYEPAGALLERIKKEKTKK